MILLVSHTGGLEIDFVIDGLKERRAPFVRVNTDDHPQGGRLLFEIDGSTPTGARTEYYGPSRTEDLRDITVGWVHQLPVVRIPDGVRDPHDRRRVMAERWASILGVLGTLQCRWITDPFHLIAASNKIRQLAEAQTIGLQVPPTLITDDPIEARRFIDRHYGSAVLKALDQPSPIANERPYAPRTIRVGDIPQDRLNDLTVSPCILQAEIRKYIELRCTIIGTRVFTAAMHTSLDERTAVDSRNQTADDHVPHQTFDLPRDVERKCLSLMKALHLGFAAIDLILTPGGDYVFLEVNTTGSWIWFEKIAGLPISDAIADFLVTQHTESVAARTPNH